MSSVSTRLSSSARLLQRGAGLINPLAKLGGGHGLGCACDSCKPSGSHGKTCVCSACNFKGFQVPAGSRAYSSATGNRGVIFMGPNHVEVQDIPFPKLELDSTTSPVASERQKRKCQHGVILKVVSTNICGSDQHMVRGRTSLPGGHMVLGHEITGEVVECGNDVEFIKKGDLCSVPFNIACGRCPMCKAGHTGVCLNVNPAR